MNQREREKKKDKKRDRSGIERETGMEERKKTERQ